MDNWIISWRSLIMGLLGVFKETVQYLSDNGYMANPAL